MDFTGPFEVLSRLQDSQFHILWKEKIPVAAAKGLMLTPTMTFADAPPLDLLVVPGGWGQQDLMDDDVVLSFLREQARHVQCVLSVCTGALICGAAGLLNGMRATTHWTAHHLLEYFGAIPVAERVVIDGNLVSTAGVTAGIDGALSVAALLCGERVAQTIQLSMEYAPQPPFASGTPDTAPPEIVELCRKASRAITEARLRTAEKYQQQNPLDKRG